MHAGIFAARLGYEQPAGSHIPWIQTELPERVQTAAGHISQIDRRRSAAAYAVRQHAHLMVEVNVDALVAFAAGEAGGDERVFELRGLGNVNGAAIEECTGAKLGGEQLIVDRIEDHARYEFALLFERHGHVEAGEAVGEVGGAIERVHIPAETGRAFVASALFS